MAFKKFIFVFLLTAVISMNATASFEAGQKAYDKRDYEAAYKEFSASAEKGDAQALRMIGQMYMSGYYVQQDVEKAVDYYKKSAEKGDLDAIWEMAKANLNGWGMKKSSNGYEHWLTVGALKGDERAALKLGFAYWNGENGIDVDLQKAVRFMEIAASIEKTGHSFAKNSLMQMYLNQGDGKKALYWAEKAASSNNPDRLYDLAWLYEKGIGTKKDVEKAISIYQTSDQRSESPGTSFAAY